MTVEYLGTNKPINKIQPVVSVCITTYNHESFIAECLDSILMQETNFAYEIILGEDESSDGTREICKSYAEKHPDKIRLFLRDDKDKICINGNKTGRFNFIEGLKAARGKYNALCDGDDYWTDPLKLQKQFDILEANPEFVVCHHWHRYSYLDNDVWVERDAPIANQGYQKTEIGTVRDIFENKLRVKTRTMFFRNFFTNHEVPNWFTQVAFGDVPLNFFLGKFGNYYFIDKPMAVYRQTDTGVSKAGLSELGRNGLVIQHSRNWIEIWDYANRHYDFEYKKEAFATVNEFLKRIVINSPLSINSVFQVFWYNSFKRKLPFLRTVGNTTWLLKYYSALVNQKVKQKLKLD